MSRFVLCALIVPLLSSSSFALGKIRVTSDVPAYVSMTGHKLGRAPLTLSDLKRGTYELQITAFATGETRTFRVSIPLVRQVVRKVDVKFGPRATLADSLAHSEAKIADQYARQDRVGGPMRMALGARAAAAMPPAPSPYARIVQGAPPPTKVIPTQVAHAPQPPSPSIRERVAARRRAVVAAQPVAAAPAPVDAPPAPLPPRIAYTPPSPLGAPAAKPKDTGFDFDEARARWAQAADRWTHDKYTQRHLVAGGVVLLGATVGSAVVAGVGIGGALVNEAIHRDEDPARPHRTSQNWSKVQTR